MPITIVVSPSATGKTAHCIRRVRQVLEDRPLATMWIVLPDRLQSVATRRRLASEGGGIGVHIGTFGNLYHEILMRAGRPVPIASEPVIQQLLRAAVQDTQKRGELVHFSPIADKPGFLRVLRDRFAELKRAQVWPETFLDIVKQDKAHLGEFARIYTVYQARLQELEWADPEGLNWLAVEELESEPDLATDWALLIVDGFDSFNGSQLSALKLLGERLPELIITLPGAPDGSRVAHRRFARSFEKLVEVLPNAVVETIADPPYIPKSLSLLEQNLFESISQRFEGGRNITMRKARSPSEEAREALRWLKARIMRDGVLLHECALVTPDPERYRPLLREAGAEFGLPIRFTHGEALTSAPGIAALLDLLELYVKNWPRRLTLEAIRTPYFDLTQYEITSEDAAVFEDVSLFGQVIEGLDQWEEALSRLARAEASPEEDLGEVIRLPRLPRGDEAASFWRRLHAFSERLMPSGAQTTKEWVQWLEDLLEELKFFEQSETTRDESVSLDLRETLRALVLGEVVAGESVKDYQAFLIELRSALEGTFYKEPMDWRQPAILTLRVLEARGLRFQAVAVLGLSEGLFPEVEREDPFLDENIRQALGLEPRLGREQGGLFYQAVTRTDQYLLLTRPYLAEDGEYWEASPFWKSVESLLQEKPVTIRPDSPRSLPEAASAEELLFWAVRRESLPERYTTDLMTRWEQLRHARDIVGARLARDPSGVFEGEILELTDQLRGRYGPEHIWSPSRLERYGTCPYMFYAASALNLEPREPPQPGFDAAQLGSMLHAILEQAYRQAEDLYDPESVVISLRKVAKAEFGTAPERYGFRPTALWEIEQEQFTEALVETVHELSALEVGWTPAAFEGAFGIGDIPALEIIARDEKVRLRGFIDRVDRNEQGELRIVDYKTGSSHLAQSDLINGRRLQLPLYALGAQHVLGLGDPVEGIYWAILAARAGSLRLSRFRYEDQEAEYHGPQGAIDVAKAHVARIVSGVRAGEFPPVPPNDGCPAYCPAATWCWRFEPAGWP